MKSINLNNKSVDALKPVKNRQVLLSLKNILGARSVKAIIQLIDARARMENKCERDLT